MATNQARWTVDKHIPVALILAILVQTGGAIWFAAKMESRVEALESQASVTHQLLEKIESVNARLVRIETLIDLRKSGGNS